MNMFLTLPKFTGVMWLFFCSFAIFVVGNSLLIANESKATALLKGVAIERLKQDCFQIQYVESRRDEGKTVTQIVDFCHGKIRKEHLKNDTFSGMMSIFLGDFLYVKTRYDADSVELVSASSSHAYGADIYDPRLFGLTDMMHLQKTVEDCLGYSSGKKFTVESTSLEGRDVQRVFWEKEGIQWEFYIEEPGFRVLKHTMKDSLRYTQIDNSYENMAFDPFPSTINILRKVKGEIRIDRMIIVIDLKKRKSFPPKTFSLDSLNLPINAMVTDYRVNRLAGYWDGEKLVDQPVRMSAHEQRELEKKKNSPPLGNTARYVLMGTGLLMVLIAIVSMIRKRRDKTRQGQT